jgi:hypothetical protein
MGTYTCDIEFYLRDVEINQKDTGNQACGANHNQLKTLDETLI